MHGNKYDDAGGTRQPAGGNPDYMQLAYAALDQLGQDAIAGRANVLSRLAVAQQLERLNEQWAKTAPLLEDLKDLDAIAKQLERIAGGTHTR